MIVFKEEVSLVQYIDNVVCGIVSFENTHDKMCNFAATGVMDQVWKTG